MDWKLEKTAFEDLGLHGHAPNSNYPMLQSKTKQSLAYQPNPLISVRRIPDSVSILFHYFLLKEQYKLSDSKKGSFPTTSVLLSYLEMRTPRQNKMLQRTQQVTFCHGITILHILLYTIIHWYFATPDLFYCKFCPRNEYTVFFNKQNPFHIIILWVFTPVKIIHMHYCVLPLFYTLLTEESISYGRVSWILFTPLTFIF